MKKFIVKTFIGFLAFSIGIAGAYAWYIATNEVSHSVTISLSPINGANLVVSNETNNSLAPITGNASKVKNLDGSDTTAYYSATMCITSPYPAANIYFDGFDCDKEIAKALRLQTSYNSNVRLFAPTGATTDYKFENKSVQLQSDGLIGLTYGTSNVYVKVFLEGNDAACVNANYLSSLDIKIKFRLEEVAL